MDEESTKEYKHGKRNFDLLQHDARKITGKQNIKNSSVYVTGLHSYAVVQQFGNIFYKLYIKK